MNNIYIYIYEFGILKGQVQWALWSFISVLMGTFIGCNSSYAITQSWLFPSNIQRSEQTAKLDHSMAVIMEI